MNLVAFLNDHLEKIDFNQVTAVQPKSCTSFQQFIEVCRKDMTVTDSLEECLALCFAVHLSVKLAGVPLWFYLVGAPSSGKSTICELMSADEFNSRPLSKITGLVSGSRQGTHLAPLLNGKCVVIKDGTLLLESTPIQLANVYGEFRDIFDGSLEAHYRNGVSASFQNIYFSMIIGITERVYGLNMSAIGERFLHMRLEMNRSVELVRNERAVEHVFLHSRKTVTDGDEDPDLRSFPLQRQYSAGFLSFLHNRIRNEEVLRLPLSPQVTNLIQSCADVIACSRAQAPHDRKDLVLYDSRPESSTRVVEQLSRLVLCLCYVYGVRSITPKILSLLLKVTLDSSHSRQHSIIRAVSLSEQGLTNVRLSYQTGIPLESSRKILLDLESMAIIQREEESTNQSGGARNKIVTTPDWITKAFRDVEKEVTDADTTQSKTTRPKKKRPVRRRPKRPKRKKKVSRSSA